MSLTHHDGLSITPNPRGGTAMQVTGTITFAGYPAVTGSASVSGTTRMAYVAVNSAANGACGVKVITSASSGVGAIASNKIVASSRIFLTPVAGTQAYPMCGIRAVGTGTASIYLKQFNATGATASGSVFWLVVNK